MNRTEGRRSPRKGLTVVEILVVAGIAILVIGGIIFIMTQFRRGFSKGEESIVVLQEGGLFLATLRHDMVNAVSPSKDPIAFWKDSIAVAPEKLRLNIYKDTDGNIEPVEYFYEPRPTGGSISRVQGTGGKKILVNNRVASLTWKLGAETVSATGMASGVRQLWVDLDFIMGGQGRIGIKSKELTIRTKLFPTRLNRQINR